MEPTRRSSSWIAAAPNCLSGLRLLLAAIFPLLPAPWRLPVVVAGGLTDWLDGLIARRFDVRSVSGGLLDAIADKLFVLSVLLTLAADGLVPWWAVPLLILRDLTMGYIALHTALRRDWAAFRRMPPRVGGKATTLCQFGLFVVVLASPWPWAVWAVVGVTIAASAFAASDYLVRFIRALGTSPPGDSGRY